MATQAAVQLTEATDSFFAQRHCSRHSRCFPATVEQLHRHGAAEYLNSAVALPVQLDAKLSALARQLDGRERKREVVPFSTLHG